MVKKQKGLKHCTEKHDYLLQVIEQMIDIFYS